MGPYFDRYGAISPDIQQYQAILGRYWAISKDIRVNSSSAKSVMYWARPIQVVPGQLYFVPLSEQLTEEEKIVKYN